MSEKVRRFWFKSMTYIEWCESDFSDKEDPVVALGALKEDDAWNVLRDQRMKDLDWKLDQDTGVIDDTQEVEKVSVPCDDVYNAIKELREKGMDTKKLEDAFCDFECAWREHACEFHEGEDDE